MLMSSSNTEPNIWTHECKFKFSTFVFSWSKQLWVSSFPLDLALMQVSLIDCKNDKAPQPWILSRLVHKISLRIFFHGAFVAYYWWPEILLKVGRFPANVLYSTSWTCEFSEKVKENLLWQRTACANWQFMVAYWKCIKLTSGGGII